MIHFSSSMILISIDDNYLNKVLNTFKCSVTEMPSLILIRYSFFLRNNLFTRYFDWYKIPKLFHIFLDESSPKTFKSTKFARQIWILLLTLLSSFSHSFVDMLVGWVPGHTVFHYFRSTRISSILSFQSSKFWPFNFSISILELLVILYHDI